MPTHEQRDVDEFCGMLFDRLEATGGAGKRAIAETFGGEVVYQVKCQTCGYRSERGEPQYLLKTKVQGQRTLEDSLRLLVKGEALSGDNQWECPQCAKKVDAMRRCAIRTLPKVLIVHLLRFEFLLTTMSKVS